MGCTSSRVQLEPGKTGGSNGDKGVNVTKPNGVVRDAADAGHNSSNILGGGGDDSVGASANTSASASANASASASVGARVRAGDGGERREEDGGDGEGRQGQNEAAAEGDAEARRTEAGDGGDALADEVRVLSRKKSRPVRAKMGSSTHIGAGFPPMKKENQDVVKVLRDYGPDEDILMACCLDGHGQYGKLIADFTSEWLEENVTKWLERLKPADDDEWTQCLTAIFNACEDAIKTSVDIGFRAKLSGTTATLVLVKDEGMHVANVGDSRCVVFSRDTSAGKPQCEWLTSDHRPEDDAERQRIVDAGGIVRPSIRNGDQANSTLPLRVWLQDKEAMAMGFGAGGPGLMLTRTLGDLIAKMAGCTHLPSVKHRKLCLPRDRFWVVASDGVWDVLDDLEVAKCIEDNLSLDDEEQMTVCLRELAVKKWRSKGQADNIGIILAMLGDET